MSNISIPRLEDWITPDEAAKILGITRQAVHARIWRGGFESARRIGSHVFMRESEVRRLAHAAGPPPLCPPGLTPRQCAMLLAIERGTDGNPGGYGHYITTMRALERRNLVVRCDGYKKLLTDDGHVACEAIRQHQAAWAAWQKNAPRS